MTDTMDGAADGATDFSRGFSRDDARDDARSVTLPVGALAALRGAVLAAPDGQLRLRDAGFAAGGALYEAFADRARRRTGHDPVALPLPDFAAELGAFFREQGWGALDATAEPNAETVALAADDWAEADAESETPAAYPACHFSTGMFAGFLARVAGRPLAVLETRCRAAGDERCEFVVGSPPVMDRLWERIRAGEGD